MPVADIEAIVSQINTQGKTLFITQEVVGGVASGPTGSLRPSDYSGIGYVTECVVLFRIGRTLDAVLTQLQVQLPRHS